MALRKPKKVRPWVKAPKAKKAVKGIKLAAPFKITASKYKEAKAAVYKTKGGNLT